jgi:hypothetical protein
VSGDAKTDFFPRKTLKLRVLAPTHFLTESFRNSNRPGQPNPVTSPKLPARNPTTEHAEHTEIRALFLRVFRAFRGLPNPGTVPSYQPRMQPQNTPNTRKSEPFFSVCSVFSVVYQTQGLSPVTSREFNHRTRRTHGNQSPLSPCVPCFPWFTKPRDCPQLPAKNATTEHAEHTEIRAVFFRVFRGFRG